MLAGVALAIAGCGGSGGGGIRPVPPPAPAVVGVVEDARDSHARDVSRIVAHTGGTAARIESVHISFEEPRTLEEFVERAYELLAGLPLTESSTPESFAEQLSRYDITNGSYSLNTQQPLLELWGAPIRNNQSWTGEIWATYALVRRDHPDWWAAVTQTNVPAHQRTIRVWAAGNERRTDEGEIRGCVPTGDGGLNCTFGDGAISEHHVKLFNFDEFWGHELIVTALDRYGRSIAPYANFCGPTPAIWDAARHGRHFCLAAPGHALEGPGQGTSFAAPRVAGVLARMHVASRETMRGSHLVKRLMDTADNTGAFADTNIYGAGRLNAARALSPRGALSYASTNARSYNAQGTAVALPSAYGDAGASLAGTEFMAWDEDRFPFWLPAESIVTAGRRTASPIPRITEESGAAAACPLGASLTGGAACFSREGSRWSALAGPGGGGVGYALNAWSSVDAYTRTDGRLDGRGSGGLALAGGSSLLGLTAHKAWGGIGGIDALRAETRVTLAVDAPWGAGKAHGAMLDVGTTLLSTAEATLTFAHGGATTSLRLAQPPRAEAGAATLRYPVTRTLDAVPVFEHQSFSLSPSRRELTASLRHERDEVAGGRLAFVVSRTEHPGHTRAQTEHSLGVAWRMQF